MLQHCAKVMISNFREIRQNLRISGGNIGNILCIYFLIVCEISRRENCRCGYSFRRDENSAQNESWVLFAHFWWTINDKRHERNKVKGLIIMIIIYEFIKRKCLCNYIIKCVILLLPFPIINLNSRLSGLRPLSVILLPNQTVYASPEPTPKCLIPSFSFIYGWPLVNTGKNNKKGKQWTAKGWLRSLNKGLLKMTMTMFILYARKITQGFENSSLNTL